MPETKNNGKDPQKNETTDPTAIDESAIEIELSEDSGILAEVEEMIYQIEADKDLKKLIAEFDKKSKNLKFKDILELDKKMVIETKDAKKERDKYLNLLQRFKADFENHKKRSQKQTENSIRFSSERIISKIFEPIEDVNRAITFAEKNTQETVPLDGLKIIYNKLTRILEDEEVALICPEPGDEFDPRFHEAIVVDPSGKHEPGKVVQTFEKGFKMKDRVLRVAKIMVAAEEEAETKEEKETDE